VTLVLGWKVRSGSVRDSFRVTVGNVREGNPMIEYLESKIARQEYEERVRGLARIDDYDVWLTPRAGNWLSQQVGSLLLSLGKSLAALTGRREPRQGIAPDSAPAGQRRSRVPGFTQGQ
jgi:hypothetical protein